MIKKSFILQSLLEKYIEEQKKIIILMEERKETMTAAEKTSMMDMLKLHKVSGHRPPRVMLRTLRRRSAALDIDGLISHEEFSGPKHDEL